ncbi:MAG TPA: response regulator [Planctomycetaceae bacterium]|nr:response regulator [Planctomycetaceae bacterium]
MTATRRILVIDDNKDIHADFRKVFHSIRRPDDELQALESDLFGEADASADASAGEARDVLVDVVIDSADPGEEGIQMAVEADRHGRPYDMAFVDVRMPPGIDGVQTIKELWRQLPDLQCVICTAFSDYDWEEILRHVGKAGNLLILKKPFDSIEVLQLAQSLAEKTDLSRAAREYQRKLERQVAELTRAQADLRRYNEQLEAARVEAEAANQSKSEFLANISHELRTPLNAVIGMTELLLDTPLNPQQQRYSSTVKSSGETLLELIDEILDISKIEAGRLELEQIPFDLSRAIEPVVELVAHKCRTKNLELAYFVDPRIPATLDGDPARLRQILTNLANNAVKFTEQGEVVIRAEVQEEHQHYVVVRFSVRDTGIGIPANRIDRLFRVFSQVDASTTRKYGGTGLGLAISRQLCLLMHGEIGVESTAGAGSTFWFTVPLRKAPGDAHEGDRLPIELHGLPVLVLDASATSRDILREQLVAWGFQAEAIGDAAAAAARLHAASAAGQPFRLLFARLERPETDGPELVRRFEPVLAGNSTALIALISLGCPFDRAALEDEGFVDVVTRPVKQSELFDVIMNAVGGGDRAAAGGRRNRPGRGTAAPAPCPSEAPRDARILVAEDNVVNQDVVVEILKRAGFRYEIVPDGRQAVDAVAASAFDLVLMDCQMPEMGGLEATRVIRQNEAAGRTASRRPLPIIALTANAMKQDRERCLKAGMTDYLSKPLNPRRLIETIEAHLAERSEAEPTEECDRRGGGSPRNVRMVEDAAAGSTDGGIALLGPGAAPADGRPTDSWESEERPVWNRGSFLDRCMNNPQIAARIVSRFQLRSGEELRQLLSSVEARDAQGAAALAHALKGAAANVSAEALSQVAAALEQSVRAGRWETASRCAGRLEIEWTRFRESVEHEPCGC